MKTFNFYPANPLQRQSGIALITSLILLVVMTLLGLAAIRGVTQEERMAGHSYSRSLGFQSAESALRTVEELVEANKPIATSSCGVVSNVMTCPAPTATSTSRWLDSSFSSWTALTAVGSGSLAVTPQYFVEHLGNNFPCDPADLLSNLDCKRYRITVRSSDGDDGKTSVMLQSMYATD